MQPSTFLIAVVSLLVLAVLVEAIRLHLRRRQLRALARQWDMHFAPGDRLRLAIRIADQLHIPGAANVRVRDLIFRTDHNSHHYLFTVQYTVGVTRGKVGRWRVAGFQEPVSRGVEHRPTQPSLVIAPPKLSPAAAYDHVRQALASPTNML